MWQKILGLFFSIFLIVGGASGELVLRGTNSSEALMVAGVIFLIWDIYSIATHKKDSEEMKRLQEEAKAAYAGKYAHAYPGKKKGWAIAWWVLGLYGFLGLHSFYLGRKKTGLLKIALLLSFCLTVVIVGRTIGKSGRDTLMILFSFGISAIFIWNIVDLVKIIRLPKAAFEAGSPGSAPLDPVSQKIQDPVAGDSFEKRINAPEQSNNVNWQEQKSNGSTYRSCKAQTLYRATEILRSISFVVETKEGRFERQCYACGTVNKIQRGQIKVMTQSGFVAI